MKVLAVLLAMFGGALLAVCVAFMIASFMGGPGLPQSWLLGAICAFIIIVMAVAIDTKDNPPKENQ